MSLEKNRTEDDFIEEEKDIISGEVSPKDRLQNQIRLATMMYATLNDKKFDVETNEGRNEIMEFWTNSKDGEKSFSELYRGIEEHPDFIEHPKFKGDIYKITVDDILYYKESGELPPDGFDPEKVA